MIASVRDLFPKPAEDAPETSGPAVNVAGRLVAKRGMGKSIFADMRDSSGKIQLFAGKNVLGDDRFAFFKKLDIGDIIGIRGELFYTRMG
ncbi:MAG: lysine--tRNA ligase, partial [Lentisphaeria bacterium]|nr:lysine--tRNA ligase [Lentisphaeria bacterium]